jgi:uncharacterized protein (TIGR02118 family)
MMTGKSGGVLLLKLTFCLRRLPTLTLPEFQDYWRNKHGPLVRRLQPALGMARYVQLHRLDNDLADGMRRVRGAPEPFDGIAELWWASEEVYRAARRSPEARDAGRLLLEDEARFIDLPHSPLWLNREEPIYPEASTVPR